MHGSVTNALVCQIYMPDEDLEKAIIVRPCASGIRCLSLIDFKPDHENLNLMAVFRSQYFDTKAYGNFIALAILLAIVCFETGYKPDIFSLQLTVILFMEKVDYYIIH